MLDYGLTIQELDEMELVWCMADGKRQGIRIVSWLLGRQKPPDRADVQRMELMSDLHSPTVFAIIFMVHTTTLSLLLVMRDFPTRSIHGIPLDIRGYLMPMSVTLFI